MMRGRIVVSGANADAYRDYLAALEDFGKTKVTTYRASLLKRPEVADAQMVALALHGQVRFTSTAREVFAPVLSAGSEDNGVAFAQLRSYLRVKSTDGAREFIAAFEKANCGNVLAAALVLLFIEANQKTVGVEEPGELPTEDDGDLDGPPDEEPPGYGGES